MPTGSIAGVIIENCLAMEVNQSDTSVIHMLTPSWSLVHVNK